MTDSEQGEYYEVAQGENLTLIAVRYGFADYKPVYDHPNNAELKRTRPNPDILYPGDRVFIPPVRVREESCATEKRHDFVMKWPKKVLRITLQDSDGKAIADAPYELTIDPPDSDDCDRVTHQAQRMVRQRTVRGKTDGDGLLEQPVPVNAAQARLKIGGLVWQLAIGYLNPAHSSDTNDIPDGGITGVQARLRNLGFYSGPVDGVPGPLTKQAIQAFQDKNNTSTRDGSCDQETLSKLKDQHNS